MTEQETPLEFACKLCVIDRRWAKLPIDLDQHRRYATEEALMDHLNSSHGQYLKGTERCWPGILQESRGVAAGVLTACGDLECTYYLLWCLHCDYETSDPVVVSEQRCPKCGRDYAYLEITK